MRYITIDKAEAGMTLAKALYDNDDRVLVERGIMLTTDYIEKLTERGYGGFYIEDELSKDIHIEETISVELRSRAVKCLKEVDIDATIDIAKAIVAQLQEAATLSLDMIDLRNFDDYTYKHSVNVAVLSTVIGMGLDLKEAELVDLCAGAMLHDLGKLSIDPEIINKPGFLTAEEYELVKLHSRLSYDLIKEKWNVAATTKAAVLEHHENEDGSGYPLGLQGEDIHRYAKIIHVADVYDALTTRRPYKKPYSIPEAMEYLMGSCGRLFEKQMVEAFMSYVPIYPKGVSLRLSDGKEGIVIENSRFRTLRPMVRLFDGTTYDLFEDSSLRNVTILATGDGGTANREEVQENEKHREYMKIKF
ncbi:HD-GYP domain-containing protein [Acetivibrio ethanolgignens]|uniref:HD-GYP domain-containing protein n=1 Tax=Acetivibrio ethanolgignens TaxID=290052 RepID=A0A0V8QHB0_9FIRM|nr:HD-GYP domain-containing protein [Acetivibrio ethanolgignens]KSV59795.1 hypothetical protein ASU35_07930 [Acetivibrio ethanolgignens]